MEMIQPSTCAEELGTDRLPLQKESVLTIFLCRCALSLSQKWAHSSMNLCQIKLRPDSEEEYTGIFKKLGAQSVLSSFWIVQVFSKETRFLLSIYLYLRPSESFNNLSCWLSKNIFACLKGDFSTFQMKYSASSNNLKRMTLKTVCETEKLFYLYIIHLFIVIYWISSIRNALLGTRTGNDFRVSKIMDSWIYLQGFLWSSGVGPRNVDTSKAPVGSEWSNYTFRNTSIEDTKMNKAKISASVNLQFMDLFLFK